MAENCGTVLAVDIGGTKTILRWTAAEGSAECLSTYASRDASSFEEILDRFFAEHRLQNGIDRLSMAVAGPVIGQTVRLTNLPWVIDGDALAKAYGFGQVLLLNDLEALGWAVPVLSPDDLVVIEPGIPVSTGSIAVIAPGTGLGQAFLTWDGERHRAFPSEGGHADFAPATEEHERLLTFLRAESTYVCVENVASGSGMANLYRFVRDVLGIDESKTIEQSIAAVEDPTPPIIEHGLAGQSARCANVLRLFSEILAAETSNVALKVMASGGIYLGGGLSPRILPLLRAPAFRSLFLRKGVYRHVLERMPIHVIRQPLAVLYGAAHYAAEIAPPLHADEDATDTRRADVAPFPGGSTR